MNRSRAASPTLRRKVLDITLISVALSVGVTAVLTGVLGSPFTLAMLAAALFCPAIVAAPVSAAFLHLTNRLEDANSRLKAANSQLALAHRALDRRCRLDNMTGLINRETFLKALSPGNRRGDEGFLCIVDVDDFKSINDVHGHRTGDRALAAIASAIRLSLREDDLAARIGGEEFGIFLRGASLAEAIAVCERVRQAVEHIEFTTENGKNIALTVSLGGAEFVGNTVVDTVMAKADRMLHEAQCSGRNRAVVVPELARVA